jgi:hypothetical protein
LAFFVGRYEGALHLQVRGGRRAKHSLFDASSWLRTREECSKAVEPSWRAMGARSPFPTHQWGGGGGPRGRAPPLGCHLSRRKAKRPCGRRRRRRGGGVGEPRVDPVARFVGSEDGLRQPRPNCCRTTPPPCGRGREEGRVPGLSGERAAWLACMGGCMRAMIGVRRHAAVCSPCMRACTPGRKGSGACARARCTLTRTPPGTRTRARCTLTHARC